MIGRALHHFEVVAKLGEGGMGEVFLAKDTKLDRLVALKLLPPAAIPDPARQRRFLAEVRAASALTHPNVCTIYEVGETSEGRPYFAMEYVKGRTLAEVIRQERIPLATLLKLGIQIADALDAAFDLRMVHRDIKPSNICLTERGQVKVLDFGLAKRLGLDATDESQGETRSGQLVGTPSYMSPEQALGRDVDHRSDLFSLGVVLYELATGRRPFVGASFGDTIDRILHRQPESLVTLAPDLPREFERIVQKCLEKDAHQRYATPRDLLADLRQLERAISAGTPASAPPAEEAKTLVAPAPGTGQPAAADQLEKGDLLLSYAVVDDLPMGEQPIGWVSRFHRDLEVRIEQLSGEPVRIGRHPNPSGQPPSDARLKELLPKVKAMISVVSPPFVKSGGCQEDIATFWDAAERSGSLRVDNRSRLLKVVRRPVDFAELAPPLSDVLPRLSGFDFFEVDPVTGRLWEYDESFGTQAKQRYHERVYDLAREVTQVLKAYRQLTESKAAGGAEASRTGKVVFLAETTADLRSERDKLRRELIERGHRVLPDHPLPVIGPELEASLRALLPQCNAAVHLVGTRYGLVPEGATESVVELQLRIARAADAGAQLVRLVWMPADLAPQDPRQSEFVRRLHDDPALHTGGDLICGSLNLLKDLLLRRLDPPAEAAPAADSTTMGGPPRVYLVCDPSDEDQVSSIEDYLFESGCEVSLPLFQGTSGEIAEAHRRNLVRCDAVLVFFGTPTSHWVEIKLMDMAQAPGYGRARPFKAQAVLVPPSEDRRKNRFRTHLAEVIRPPTYPDTSSLQPFLQRVLAASSPG